jgi:hypothetical protein
MKEVEKEVIMGILVWKKNLPRENWLESLVKRITGDSMRVSLVRVRFVVVLKELKMKSRELMVGIRRRRWRKWKSGVSMPEVCSPASVKRKVSYYIGWFEWVR